MFSKTTPESSALERLRYYTYYYFKEQAKEPNSHSLINPLFSSPTDPSLMDPQLILVNLQEFVSEMFYVSLIGACPTLRNEYTKTPKYLFRPGKSMPGESYVDNYTLEKLTKIFSIEAIQRINFPSCLRQEHLVLKLFPDQASTRCLRWS